MASRQQSEDFEWYKENFARLYEKYGAGWVVIADKRVHAVCRTHIDGVRFAENVLGFLPGEFIVEELAEGDT